jgi:hypothetical protein
MMLLTATCYWSYILNSSIKVLVNQQIKTIKEEYTKGLVGCKNNCQKLIEQPQTARDLS